MVCGDVGLSMEYERLSQTSSVRKVRIGMFSATNGIFFPPPTHCYMLETRHTTVQSRAQPKRFESSKLNLQGQKTKSMAAADALLLTFNRPKLV